MYDITGFQSHEVTDLNQDYIVYKIYYQTCNKIKSDAEEF